MKDLRKTIVDNLRLDPFYGVTLPKYTVKDYIR
jgi:hypothetical protein